MDSPSENTLFQSEQHPLVDGNPVILEDHCLSLIHLKAYETAAEKSRGCAVLDVGCNNGYGTAIVARNAERAVGIDLSPKAIDVARRTHPSVEFVQLTDTALPFADQSFDVVTAFQVIEHVEDTGPFLREIKRVLRPGGSALITTPNRLLRIDPGMKPWNPFHVREYVAGELVRELQPVFEEVKVMGLHGTEMIERVERGRNLRHKRLIRRSRGGLTSRAAASFEFRLHRVLRRAAAAAVKLPMLGSAQHRRFASYRLSDLHYSEGNLDTALDLLAIVSRT
jgi:2-polyprenyl-3-methyl-5-hydroxy-6-metoxy-1,4-benzoquinol methylase